MAFAKVAAAPARLRAHDFAEVALLRVHHHVGAEMPGVGKSREVATCRYYLLRPKALHGLDEREPRHADSLHENRRAHRRRIPVYPAERAYRRLENRALLVSHRVRHLPAAVVGNRHVLGVAAVERGEPDFAGLGAEVLVAGAALDAYAAADGRLHDDTVADADALRALPELHDFAAYLMAEDSRRIPRAEPPAHDRHVRRAHPGGANL